MTERGLRIAEEAGRLVGTRYRLWGRNRDTGLDCVGLVLLALRQAGIALSDIPPYQLRNRSIVRQVESVRADRLLHLDGSAPICTGDVVLCQCGPAQHHLLIAAGQGGFIHAHAGLRRVVSQPGSVPWPITSIFRIREKE